MTKESQAMVFPWAIAVYQNKEVNIPLLKIEWALRLLKWSFGAASRIFNFGCLTQNHNSQAKNGCRNQRQR
jgi:hypothetical protein